MSVYVDDMEAGYRNMKMCHMLADTEEELIEMAKQIGVQLKWHQYKGTYKSHFDICKSKKELAIRFGAILIDGKEVGKILKKKKNSPLL